MIQNVLRDMGGVALYGVVSICLFFGVFSVAMIYACLLKKPFLNSMGALPLQDSQPTPSTLSKLSKGDTSHE